MFDLADDTLDPERLVAANINPQTRLATDYLNHFNEVIMLVELVADMPDVAPDILAWTPRDYVEHFAESGFREKELAIAAYRTVDPERRAAFEAVISRLDALVFDVQALVASAPSPLSPELALRLNDLVAGTFHPLIDAASGLINGTDEATSDGAAQSAIDALFG